MSNRRKGMQRKASTQQLLVDIGEITTAVGKLLAEERVRVRRRVSDFVWRGMSLAGKEGFETLTALCAGIEGHLASEVADRNTPLTTVPPTTAPSTTAAPTTAPGTPTTTTGGAVSPTSVANVTTDPGALPTTGGSDATLLIALVVLAAGGVLLIVARRFHTLDE